MSNLLIVDGNSILNRAFYGIRPLSTRDGTPTNAVFGFINILKKHMDALTPDYLVCAFDLHAPTFRHKLYDAYKAGRHPMPDELAAQFPIAKETAAAMGFTVMSLEEYEADDLLGTVSARAAADGIDAYVLTGDKDSLQLIGEKTHVILAKTKEDICYDTAAFRQEYGILPSQFVDVKALMGDPSDNIPGVSGIGQKTALKLIGEFGSLDTLYDKLPEAGLSPALAAKLLDGKESAFFSRTLATICREAPIAESLSDLKTDGPDKDALRTLFRRLEFTSFDKKFALEENSVPLHASDIPEEQIVTPEALPASVPLSLVTEPGKDEWVLHLSDGHALYRVALPLDALPSFFAARPLVCHDLKSLYHLLLPCNVTPDCVFDTMLADYLLHPGDSRDPLARLTARYLHETSEAASPAEQAYEIAALYPLLAKELEDTGMTELLRTVELPLSPVLAEMEETGFRLDTAGLAHYAAELGAAAAELEQMIFLKAGSPFNINSPKQLGEVLYTRLGLPVGKKTQSGFSTDAETLEKLRPYHPIVADILDYRTITKLKSTYGDALIPLTDSRSHIHTTFNQTGTATGRLSSADPNLQNIPVRGQLGRELRKFFTADGEGRLLLDADYSQIELRLLAELSGDKTMSDAFLNGFDIHAATASQVFHVPLEQMTSEIRSRAKAVNFGIVYGIGDYSLSQDLKISRRMAGEYIANYLATYPDVDRYLKKAVQDARENGYATTYFGRRRPLPELAARNKNLQAFGERVAMNSPIQGTAADIIKLAMIRVHQALKESGIDARLILQVHDELLIECAASCRDQAVDILRDAMEHAVETHVPLSVEVSSGFTWYDAKA